LPEDKGEKKGMLVEGPAEKARVRQGEVTPQTGVDSKDMVTRIGGGL